MKSKRLYPILSRLICVMALGLLFFGCKKDDTTPPVETQTTPWPSWVFSHWVWLDEATQAEALQLVDDYIAHDIPVGATFIDSPWETGYNTFDFAPALYPNPKAMVDYFHSKDVRCMLWITSAVNEDAPNIYQEAYDKRYFMQADAASGPKSVSWWKGKGGLVDFYNPEAVAWWKKMMDKSLDLGIDGWKCDGADFYALEVPYSPGKGAEVSRLDYSYAYYRLFYDYTREKLGKDRIVMSRPVDNYGLGFSDSALTSFSPVDIGWSGWVGDQDATFDGMKAALNNMYYSSKMGYLAFGSDIGGYREDDAYPTNKRSKELFIRWAQLGALSPVMENGGGGEHRPWKFDDETANIYRRFAKLHHALIPYFMENSQAFYNARKSLMDFYNDQDYDYLLGPDLFVAPVLSNVTQMNVKLPAGNRWVYLFDKTKSFDGGQTLNNFAVPLNEFPVFVKQGSKWVDGLKVE